MRRVVIREKLLEYKCARCGIDKWMGEPLAFDLHHKNGDGKDHRVENMEWLCPNCHSLTGSYCGRNMGKTTAQPAAVSA